MRGFPVRLDRVHHCTYCCPSNSHRTPCDPHWTLNGLVVAAVIILFDFCSCAPSPSLVALHDRELISPARDAFQVPLYVSARSPFPGASVAPVVGAQFARSRDATPPRPLDPLPHRIPFASRISDRGDDPKDFATCSSAGTFPSPGTDYATYSVQF